MAIQLTVMSLDFESDVSPSTKKYEKQEITIGRSTTNDVVLDLPEVSDVHAKLTARYNQTGGAALYLTDLGSLNGTRVENELVESENEIEIEPHQRIQIGRFLIKPTVRGNGTAKVIDVSLGGSKKRNGKGSKKLDIDELFKSAFSKSKSHKDEPAEEIEEAEEVTDELLTDTHEDFEAHEEHDEVATSEEIMEDVEIGLEAAETEEDTHQEAEHDETEEEVWEATPVTGDISADGITLRVVDNDIAELNFIATQLFTVSGVVKHHGKPLSGVEIDGGSLGTTTTANDGTFSFVDVAEDTEYEITAKKEKFQFKGENTIGAVTGDCSINLAATQLFAIAGRIVHRGQPLEGVLIDGGSLGTTTSDKDGRYEFTNVPENTEFTLTASKDGFIFGQQTVKK